MPELLINFISCFIFLCALRLNDRMFELFFVKSLLFKQYLFLDFRLHFQKLCLSSIFGNLADFGYEFCVDSLVEDWNGHIFFR